MDALNLAERFVHFRLHSTGGGVTQGGEGTKSADNFILSPLLLTVTGHRFTFDRREEQAPLGRAPLYQALLDGSSGKDPPFELIGRAAIVARIEVSEQSRAAQVLG